MIININNEIIKSILKATYFLNKKVSNKNYDGVYLNLFNNNLEIVATDGIKLYYNKIELDNNNTIQFLIPSNFIKNNKDFIKKLTQIKIEGKEIIFINNNDSLKINMQDIIYPDYKSYLNTYSLLTEYREIELKKEYIKQLQDYIKSNNLKDDDKIAMKFNKNIISSLDDNFKIITKNNYKFQSIYNINYLKLLLKINKNISIPLVTSVLPCVVKNNNEIGLLMPIIYR